MEKKINPDNIELFTRQIVKLALDLPQDKIGANAQKEILTSSTRATTAIKLALLEKPGKQVYDQLNLVLENLSNVKFWLDFLAAEEYLSADSYNSFMQSAEENIIQTHAWRSEHEKLLALSYPGEWFLVD